jgi:predicted PolB exonuclease-like 3'-5' exonuclease
MYVTGTMSFIHTWNSDVENALKKKLEFISQEGVFEELKQTIQKLNNIILNQEQELVDLQTQNYQLKVLIYVSNSL